MNRVVILSLFLMAELMLFSKENHDYGLKEMRKLTNQFVYESCKKYNMTLCSIGGGSNNSKTLNLVERGFEIRGPLNKDELRKILVKLSDDYLLIINNHPKLMPYYRNEVFNINNIGFILFNRDKQGNRIYSPEISIASLLGGKFKFKTFSSRDVFTDETETYEEGLTKLKAYEVRIHEENAAERPCADYP